MSAAGGRQISPTSTSSSRTRTSTAASSFIQVVQDDGDWFEPRDIVRLVLKSQRAAAGRLVKAERGRYEVVACAPMVSAQGRCLEVSLREIRRG